MPSFRARLYIRVDGPLEFQIVEVRSGLPEFHLMCQFLHKMVKERSELRLVLRCPPCRDQPASESGKRLYNRAVFQHGMLRWERAIQKVERFLQALRRGGLGRESLL